MLFKRRRIEPTDSLADLTRQRLHYALQDASSTLHRCAEKVVVLKGVIDLYPDGPDKDAAIEDLNRAKYSLLCAIGGYDGAHMELRDFINKHRDELRTTTDWWEPRGETDSHQIIERAYEGFLRRR